jgi:hypothetical protein
MHAVKPVTVHFRPLSFPCDHHSVIHPPPPPSTVYFITVLFKEPKNRIQGINSASLCSLAGQFDNPIPTRFLAPIDCFKIPALVLFLTRSYLESLYLSHLKHDILFSKLFHKFNFCGAGDLTSRLVRNFFNCENGF